jgi:hypothetical protein
MSRMWWSLALRPRKTSNPLVIQSLPTFTRHLLHPVQGLRVQLLGEAGLTWTWFWSSLAYFLFPRFYWIVQRFTGLDTHCCLGTLNLNWSPQHSYLCKSTQFCSVLATPLSPASQENQGQGVTIRENKRLELADLYFGIVGAEQVVVVVVINIIY